MSALQGDRRLSAAVTVPPLTSTDPRPRRIARPLYLLLTGLVSGIYLAGTISIPPLLLFAAGAALLAAAVTVSRKQSQTVVSLILLTAPFVVIGAGLARQAALPLANDISVLASGGPSIWIRGTVTSEVERHPSGALSFTLNASAIDDFQSNRSATGRVQVVITHPDTDAALPRTEDLLWLRGRIEEPAGITNPNGFDARAYLARRGIHSTLVVRRSTDMRSVEDSRTPLSLERGLMAARNRILSIIDASLGPEDAAILGSILLSEHSGLPAGTKNAFERTGSLHILSVSGLHLAAVAGVLSWLLGAVIGIPRRIANPIVVAVLWAFAAASGGGIAAIRAAIVFTIVLMAPVLHRSTASPLHSLGVAAFVLLVASPLSLYEPGFQLSFATLATLMLWLPLLEKLFLPWEPGQSARDLGARYVLTAFAAGLVAQIGSWPLVAYHYNIFSVVSPEVSVLVAPLAVFLLLGGLGTAGLSLLLPNSLMLPGWGLIQIVLHLLRGITSSFAALPFAAFSIMSPPPILIVIYYALLGGGASFVRKKILERKVHAPRAGGLLSAASALANGANLP